MRIKLLCVGKTDDPRLRELITYYSARLPRHWNFDLVEIPDIKAKQSADLIKKQEAKLLQQQIDSGDYNILLDENGREYTSRQFSEKMMHLQNASIKKINFLIGGAYGFSEEMYSLAQEKISLSKMTFTHQMVRLFLIEQLYRADQILQGKPYHND